VKKIRLIVFVMIVAFAVMGAGYAAWTDVTEINGTITTGWLDVIFENPISTDPGDTPEWMQLINVGSTEATIARSEKKTLEIEITNGYPGYESQVTFDIKNNSTIPVKVKDVAIQRYYDSELDVDLSEISDLIGKEMAVGETIKNIAISNYVTEDAKQETNYSYAVTITFQQWNID